MIKATMKVATPRTRNSTTDFRERNASGIISIGIISTILYLCHFSLGIIIRRWYRLEGAWIRHEWSHWSGICDTWVFCGRRLGFPSLYRRYLHIMGIRVTRYQSVKDHLDISSNGVTVALNSFAQCRCSAETIRAVLKWRPSEWTWVDIV